MFSSFEPNPQTTDPPKKYAILALSGILFSLKVFLVKLSFKIFIVFPLKESALQTTGVS